MRIALVHAQGARALLDFDPGSIDDTTIWKGQKRFCKHRSEDNTRLPPPFDRIFLKRWREQEHSLLQSVRGKALPGTPGILGCGQVGTDWIYVSERLPNSYKLLYDLLDGATGGNWLTAPMLISVVQQAAQTFEAITLYRHVFTDFSTKNIMVDPSTGRIFFIDLDSAWSHDFLVEQKGLPIPGYFDTQFWILWKEQVEVRIRCSRQATELLPRTMVASFAAAWGHALGLLANPQLPQAQRLRDSPGWVDDWAFANEQQALWQALSYDNEEEFREFFLLPSSPPLQRRHEDLFDRWHTIFNSLVHGDYVPWPQIQEAAQALAREFLPEEEPKSPSSVFIDWVSNFFLRFRPEKNTTPPSQNAAAPLRVGDVFSTVGKIAAAVRDALTLGSVMSASLRQVVLVFFAHFLVAVTSTFTLGFVAWVNGGWGVVLLVVPVVVAGVGFHLGRWLRNRFPPPSLNEFILAAFGYALFASIVSGIRNIGDYLLFSGLLSLSFLGIPLKKALVGMLLLFFIAIIIAHFLG